MNKITLDRVMYASVEGINAGDYPDFCDAYIGYAVWRHNGIELTERELEELTENSDEYIYAACMDQMRSNAEDLCDRMKDGD